MRVGDLIEEESGTGSQELCMGVCVCVCMCVRHIYINAIVRQPPWHTQGICTIIFACHPRMSTCGQCSSNSRTILKDNHITFFHGTFTNWR